MTSAREKTNTLKVTSEFTFITPLMAEDWVTGQTHNRKIHDSNVQKFERLLQTDEFHVTHQGVAFSDSGRLLDGQHRLLAIVNTGIGATMMVTRGWPEDTQQFIDQGRIRTALDIEQLRNPEAHATTYHMAIARRMVTGTRGSLLLTTPDIVNFAEEHSAAISFTIDEAFQGKHPRYVRQAGVGAAVARAYYHEDRVRLIEFGSCLIGVRTPQGDPDSGAHLLREWLLQGSPIYGAVRVSKDLLIYMKTQRALQAFLAHEKLRNLYPQQDEVWTLPGEIRRVVARGSIMRRAEEVDKPLAGQQRQDRRSKKKAS